ncbi:hypothetical protein A0U94_05885 [Gluconobacter albidus]|nr:hypothetical protein A0U94_05885 [Gluconobacter albidus]
MLFRTGEKRIFPIFTSFIYIFFSCFYLTDIRQCLFLPLPREPRQAFFACEELLHEGFFLLLAVGQKLFSSLNRTIPRREDRRDLLLFGERGETAIQTQNIISI